jgi:hypothetical protein
LGLAVSVGITWHQFCPADAIYNDEGHEIERELAPVFVATDGFTGGDNVVVAEPGDMEVLGSHTLESLGVTVDPVSQKLVPMVGLALSAYPIDALCSA